MREKKSMAEAGGRQRVCWRPRSDVAAWALLGTLLGALVAAGCGGRTYREPGPNEGVRVMTWDINRGLGLDGKLDLERLRRVIIDWNVDIVLLQAVGRGTFSMLGADQGAMLAEGLDMELRWMPLNPADGGEEGLATLSRIRMERTIEEKFDRLTDLVQQQGMLGVEIAWGGHRVILWNTRLGTDPTGGEQYTQVRRIEHIVARYPQAEHVVGGNFGLTPDATPVTSMERRFRDLWLVAGSGRGYTEPSTVPRSRTDYFWASERAALRPAAIVVLGAPGYSTHLPLLVDLVLVGPAPAELPPLPEGFKPPPAERPKGPTEMEPTRSDEDIPGVTRPFGPRAP